MLLKMAAWCCGISILVASVSFAGEEGVVAPPGNGRDVPVSEFRFFDIGFAVHEVSPVYDPVWGTEVQMAAIDKRLRFLRSLAGIPEAEDLLRDPGSQAVVRVTCDMAGEPEYYATTTLEFRTDGLRVEDLRFRSELWEGVGEKYRKVRRGLWDPETVAEDLREFLQREPLRYNRVRRDEVAMALNWHGISQLASCRPQWAKEYGEASRLEVPLTGAVSRTGFGGGGAPPRWNIELWVKQGNGEVCPREFRVERPGEIADVRYEKILRSVSKVSPAVAKAMANELSGRRAPSEPPSLALPSEPVGIFRGEALRVTLTGGLGGLLLGLALAALIFRLRRRARPPSGPAAPPPSSPPSPSGP